MLMEFSKTNYTREKLVTLLKKSGNGKHRPKAWERQSDVTEENEVNKRLWQANDDDVRRTGGRWLWYTPADDETSAGWMTDSQRAVRPAGCWCCCWWWCRSLSGHNDDVSSDTPTERRDRMLAGRPSDDRLCATRPRRHDSHAHRLSVYLSVCAGGRPPVMSASHL